MKYLEHLGLERISNLIDHCELSGGLALKGRCEIYSTKRSTEEKKLAKQIESKLVSEVKSSSDGIPKPRDSPEKALPHLNLIQTLNATQLDHDFSQLPAESFVPIPVSDAVHIINSHLAELTVRNPAFLSELWKEVNGAMDNTLQKCDVYTLKDASIIDDVEDGVMWAFHYFFCSKELKRVCYFRASAATKFRHGNDYMDSDAEDDNMEVDQEGSMDGSRSSYESDDDDGY